MVCFCHYHKFTESCSPCFLKQSADGELGLLLEPHFSCSVWPPATLVGHTPVPPGRVGVPGIHGSVGLGKCRALA